MRCRLLDSDTLWEQLNRPTWLKADKFSANGPPRCSMP